MRARMTTQKGKPIKAELTYPRSKARRDIGRNVDRLQAFCIRGRAAISRVDRQINTISGKINRVERCCHRNFIIWMARAKPPQSWDEPSDRPGIMRTDLESTADIYLSGYGAGCE